MQKWYQRISVTLSTCALAASMAACGGAQKAAQPAPAAAPPLVAVVPPPPAPPQDSVTWFIGSSTTMSADGKTLFGKASAVVKRTVQPSSRQIIEELRRSDGLVSKTTLRQRGNSPVFDVSDAAATFTGTVTFNGDPYGKSSWSYAIAMTQGKLISGTGGWSDAGIQTAKVVSDATGKETARIAEQLSPASEAAAEAAAAGFKPAR